MPFKHRLRVGAYPESRRAASGPASSAAWWRREQADPGAGTVCGKLFSIGPGFQPLAEPRIDSTGIYFTPAMRHFDRGWHEPDRQRFDRMEYVFGASAAAALYRRQMIEDVSVDGEFFDPDFFVYREDADVAWRAQLLGWRCIYTPEATAYHVRTRDARQPPRRARHHQHALGEEPLPDAHQERHRRVCTAATGWP